MPSNRTHNFFDDRTGAAIGMACGIAISGLIQAASFSDPYAGRVRELEHNPAVQEYLMLKDAEQKNYSSRRAGILVSSMAVCGIFGGLLGYVMNRRKEETD